MNKQKTATLFNGSKVKEWDKVSFINSDNEKCTGKIKRRKNGTLFFWNSDFKIKDYQNAIKES